MGSQVRQRCLPQKLVCTLGDIKRSGSRQLTLRTKVKACWAESEQEKTVTVLVDTGAQVNLVNRGIFKEDAFEVAKKEVELRSIAGEKIQGGERVATIKVALEAKDWKTSKQWQQYLGGEFYLADIGVDMVVGWPLLHGHQLAVVPHRQQLLWEYPDGSGWAWLQSCRGGGEATDDQKVTLASVERKWKTQDYAVRDSLVNDILKRFNVEPVVDAFATAENKRFPEHWDETQDAFKQHWGQPQGVLWMSPPFTRMQEVVDKLARDRARAVVVAPAWTYTDWWTKLENMSTDYLNLQHPEGIFSARRQREGEEPALAGGGVSSGWQSGVR